MRRKLDALTMSIRMRNFVFGVEDSLVSTVGLLSGIAAAGASKESIIATGMILLSVESFSMGAGSYLSEVSAEEYMHEQEGSNKRSISGAAIITVSYYLSGLIPLSPYFLAEGVISMRISIALSILALFILGYFSGWASRVRPWQSALRMAVVGGIAIFVGAMIGALVR